MTTIQLVDNYYQFYICRTPAVQQLSLVLLPIKPISTNENEWSKRLYELHEFLDSHFYPIEREIMFKPIFPGSSDMLEIKVGTGAIPIDIASELLRQELLGFK